MKTNIQTNQSLMELTKYYMEFLENDFKVGTAPKRRIELEHKEHDLSYYKNYRKELKRLLLEDGESELVIKRDDSFKSIAKEDLNKLSQLFINKNDNNNVKELQNMLRQLQNKKPLLNADRTLKNAENFLKNINIEEARDLFEMFMFSGGVSDLYDYLERKEEEKKMENGGQFYLYIGTIKHNQKEYPLFFIPLEIEWKERKYFEVELGNTIHIHKKAIEKVNADYRKKHDIRMSVIKERKILRGETGNWEDDIRKMQVLIDEVSDTFQIQRASLFAEEKQVEGNMEVQISNSISIALFEKSDETILNDYAEMLELIEKNGDMKLAESFFALTQEYLTGNPKAFERQIDEVYDEQPLPEKFSFPSPIPLNKEQKQIISALNTDDCLRIVAEGPPGTGKSHTIAGVAYDHIIKNKSVLIVSDSMEALDVVEDKITEVLRKVEEENISNPILRIGKKNGNLSEIFNQANVSKLKMRFKRYSTFLEKNQEELRKKEKEIQHLINEEIEIGKKLNPDILQQVFQYEPIFEEKWLSIISQDVLFPEGTEEEQLKKKKSFIDTLIKWNREMGEIKNQYELLRQKYGFTWEEDKEKPDHISLLQKLTEQLQELKRELDEEGLLELAEDIQRKKVKELQLLIEELEGAKSPLLGYLFKGSLVKDIQGRFERLFPHVNFQMKNRLPKLKMELEYYKRKREDSRNFETMGIDVFLLLTAEKIQSLLQCIEKLKESSQKLESCSEFPHVFQSLGIDQQDVSSYFTNPIGAASEEECKELVKYIENVFNVQRESRRLAEIDIHKPMREYEAKLTTKMNFILDQNLLEFLEGKRNDAQLLRKQLRQRKKIHKEQFTQLIKAFPCIIVGIRELGEMIPLEPEIFDLVIIDEGSQVSIAQAFPALIRAKKVLVLGDSKQFGNVKSTNASLERNEFLFRGVKESFAKDFTGNTLNIVMEKVNNFDVKNSVLDFVTNISNYNTILRKHFRSYYELINYSNQHFYSGSLEVMKIRSKSLSEIIRFHELEPQKLHENKNINRKEVAFILEELKELKEGNFKGNVGIITPFRDQQQYIVAELLKDKNWVFYDEKFRVKVMTFDTCQGEERDIIFYSMVESPNKKCLHTIFPVKELVEDENRRSQRLNVGLSRAKEEVRFVISQPLESFTGEIGKALRHFESQKQTTQDISELYGKTDKNSPMEKELLNLIVQTPFYQKYKEKMEIIPQFNIGKFIKQIDPYADVKNYKTDFLIVFHSSNGKTKNVILEYDGFEFHFQKREHVNEWNYELFYTEEDIERQKTIEMYGYPFIRLNKFIMNKKPVEFLNQHLLRHLEKIAESEQDIYISQKVDDEKDVEYKYCSKCGFKKPLSEFYDENLKTKYGLNCLTCKGKK